MDVADIVAVHCPDTAANVDVGARRGRRVERASVDARVGDTAGEFGVGCVPGESQEFADNRLSIAVASDDVMHPGGVLPEP